MTTTKRRPVAKAEKNRRAASPVAAPPVVNDLPPRPVPERIEEGPRQCTEFQYAVKLVQGSAPPLTNESFIAPGRYHTMVNVHNPSTCKTVKFRWKVALADLDGKPVSMISAFREVSLRPDEAYEIDAREIGRAINIALNRFIKGFVVIEAPCELDVVAVYTALPAGQGPTAQSVGIAFHTERVPARKIDACLDLNLDISTGVAPWTVTNVPPAATTFPTVPYQAVVLQNANLVPQYATQAGALWISARALINSPPRFAAGWYVFRYCFTLCSGFTNPVLNIQAMADDRAWIRLNGLWGGTTSTLPTTPHVPWSLLGPPIVVPPITQGFLPGRNCLELVVYNDSNSHPSNPVAINLKGELKAERGACPGACDCC